MLAQLRDRLCRRLEIVFELLEVQRNLVFLAGVKEAVLEARRLELLALVFPQVDLLAQEGLARRFGLALRHREGVWVFGLGEHGPLL